MALSDDDADGIWSATISVLEGTSGNFIFLNSPNDGWDWGAKEDLSGQECADPANYNDRILEPVMEPTTISTCFGECSTDGSCAPPPTVFYDVTFNVNMANEDVSSDGVFLAGGAHFGWPGDNPMSDDDGDGIWSITVNLAEGTAGNYTFLNGNCGDWSCKEDLSGQECGDPNNYNDRILEPCHRGHRPEHLLRTVLDRRLLRGTTCLLRRDVPSGHVTVRRCPRHSQPQRQLRRMVWRLH